MIPLVRHHHYANTTTTSSTVAGGTGVDRGACSLFDVQNELPVGSCCGRCEETAQTVVDEYLNKCRRDGAPQLVAQPA